MGKVVLYINLDSATERRASIEKSFQDTCCSKWALERFAAIEAPSVANVAGSISVNEKACFISHKKAIENTLQHSENSIIAEDDCLFSKNTFTIVDELTPQLEVGSWDIMFLDVGIPIAEDMIKLTDMRRNLVHKKSFSQLDLSKLIYFGSLCYVINNRSKHKILDKLSEFSDLDMPYDLSLRYLFQQKKLNGFSIFPFVAAPSVHATISSIQDSNTQVIDETWIAFRNLMYLDRNLDQLALRTSQIKKNNSDVESRILGNIIATHVSPQFGIK